MSPLVKRKGLAPAGARQMLWGKIHLFWEASGKGFPVNVMLLLTVNVPRLHTTSLGVSETSGDVRNSHFARNGVIPPEEAEGRG